MSGGSGMPAAAAAVSPALWSMGMRLIRPRLTVAVAASSLAGALSFPAPLPAAVFPVVLGVLLLAAAGSTLNQIQERQTDARMARTCDRPFACGQLTPRSGALFTILLVLAGGAFLLAASGLVPALLGLAGLLLYNGIYTPLKRHSDLAILPGALCGA